MVGIGQGVTAGRYYTDVTADERWDARGPRRLNYAVGSVAYVDREGDKLQAST